MKKVPEAVRIACTRAATLRADWEMQDYPHRVVKNDLIVLMEFIESLPERGD